MKSRAEIEAERKILEYQFELLNAERDFVKAVPIQVAIVALDWILHDGCLPVSSAPFLRP